MNDDYLKYHLTDVDADIITFCLNQLERQHKRADYMELLNLSIIFLGGLPPRGIKFRYPGAFHHARWMSKAIYCLKMFLFRKQFKFYSNELIGIRDTCLFIVTTYIRHWFTAELAPEAPYQDFNFLMKLHKYKDIDEGISSITLKKFCGHLWYLGEESIALSFFDANVPITIKEKMSSSIKPFITGTFSENIKHHAHIKPIDMSFYEMRDISYFVTENTAKFFQRFQISTDFLNHHPSTWNNLEDYKQALEYVSQMQVVNDTAERGVQLMEQYNNILTRNEDEKQFLLQVVADYRSKYASCNKSVLIVNSYAK